MSEGKMLTKSQNLANYSELEIPNNISIYLGFEISIRDSSYEFLNILIKTKFIRELK